MIATAGQTIAPLDYHAHPAVSRTGLKCFRESRRLYHARHVLRLPEAQMEPSDAMNLGSLTHAELLEPGSLEGKYAILSDWPDFRTKAARQWRDDMLADGKIVVKPEDIAAMQAMVRATVEVARTFLQHHATLIETPVFWRDEHTGMECRCKPDWLIVTPKEVLAFDFKTTGDSSPSAFERQVNSLGLWLQESHYTAGITAKYELPVRFRFVVAETTYPYRVGIHKIVRDEFPGTMIDAEYRDTMTLLEACYRSDNWAEPWEQTVNPVRVRDSAFRSDAMGR